MNKAHREELKRLHFKRRLRLRGIIADEILRQPRGPHYNYTAFKSHGKPCSCSLCRQDKYHRARAKSEARKHSVNP